MEIKGPRPFEGYLSGQDRYARGNAEQVGESYGHRWRRMADDRRRLFDQIQDQAESFAAEGDTWQQAQVHSYRGVKGRWANEQLNLLTLEQQIGLMCLVNADGNDLGLAKLVREGWVGGFIVSEENLLMQLRLTQELQRLARLPLMVFQDWSGPCVQWFNRLLRLPLPETLEASAEPALIYQLGKMLGEFCHQAGVHGNLLSLPEAERGWERHFVKGMQDAGVMAFAKHPAVAVSLRVFRPTSMARAHVSLRLLENPSQSSATLSPVVVDQRLRGGEGFKGYLVADLRHLSGPLSDYTFIESLLELFADGVDLFELPAQLVPTVIRLLTQAVAEGRLTEGQIRARALKILLAREWLRLHQVDKARKPFQGFESMPLLDFQNLKRRLFEKLIRMPSEAALKGPELTLIQVDGRVGEFFGERLAQKRTLRRLFISSKSDALPPLPKAGLVVVALYPGAAAQSAMVEHLLETLQTTQRQVLLVSFTSLSLRLKAMHLFGYEDDAISQELAAERLLNSLLD